MSYFNQIMMKLQKHINTNISKNITIYQKNITVINRNYFLWETKLISVFSAIKNKDTNSILPQ